MDISLNNEGRLLNMELYEKPVMAIVEMEELDVLTEQLTSPETPIIDVEEDMDNL